ncbi:hypothetical protein [Thaumasiovibrio sp. DFM-14]|uniref:hypothetical protein n=1 Tax=Thaumasiovibrio sp. DFM-14 TaxID=3384792 RepID=UPI0039A1EB7B
MIDELLKPNVENITNKLEVYSMPVDGYFTLIGKASHIAIVFDTFNDQGDCFAFYLHGFYVGMVKCPSVGLFMYLLDELMQWHVPRHEGGRHVNE